MNRPGRPSPVIGYDTWDEYMSAENERKRKHKAEVAARTPNTDSLPVKVGDTVLFAPWYGGIYVGRVTKITRKIVQVDDYPAKPNQIMPATPENRDLLRKAAELDNERRKLLMTVRNTAFIRATA